MEFRRHAAPLTEGGAHSSRERKRDPEQSQAPYKQAMLHMGVSALRCPALLAL